jgi:hypothetical protein
MLGTNTLPNRSAFITLSASTPTPDYIGNRKVQWVQCPVTNAGAVTIGQDAYGPGYNGPGSGFPLAGLAGAVGDKITIVVEAP